METKAWATFPYELKVTNGNTVAFSKFQDQQLPALYDAKHGILHHKISDMSINLKPFDGFVYKNVDEAYVGIWFNKYEEAYFIDIDDVMMLKETQKSITIKDVKKYGRQIFI